MARDPRATRPARPHGRLRPRGWIAPLVVHALFAPQLLACSVEPPATPPPTPAGGAEEAGADPALPDDADPPATVGAPPAGEPGLAAESNAAGNAPAAPAPGGDGEAAVTCDTTADCPSDHLCEGEGCSPGAGTCVPLRRMCTRDYRAFCGCNGDTFHGSGSCPGRRYRHPGPCEGDAEAG